MVGRSQGTLMLQSHLLTRCIHLSCLRRNLNCTSAAYATERSAAAAPRALHSARAPTAAFHPYCVLSESSELPEILVEAAGEKNCVISFAVHFVKAFMARLDLELHGVFGLQSLGERWQGGGGWRAAGADCQL